MGVGPGLDHIALYDLLVEERVEAVPARAERIDLTHQREYRKSASPPIDTDEVREVGLLAPGARERVQRAAPWAAIDVAWDYPAAPSASAQAAASAERLLVQGSDSGNEENRDEDRQRVEGKDRARRRDHHRESLGCAERRVAALRFGDQGG
jgi:hypothetical protein